MSDKKLLKAHCCSTYYQDEDGFVNQQAIGLAPTEAKQRHLPFLLIM